MLVLVPYSQPDGTINPVYWDRLFDFEATQLGKAFLDGMRQLCPWWVGTIQKSELQQDVDIAIRAMDEAGAKRTNSWLNNMDDESRRWSLVTKFQ